MISVITITYNNFEELQKTLASISSVNNIESVVINGGSCDKTKDFLKSYNGIVVNEKDDGISDAFNKGIKNSSGNYIMFLNSGDQLIEKEYPANAENILSTKSEYSFVHSNLSFVDESGIKFHLKPPMKNSGRGMPYLHPTMVFRKNVFDKIGLFSTSIKIAMDFDFIVRMEKAGLKGYYFKDDFSVLMEGSGRSVKEEADALKECYQILKDHKYLNFKNRYGFFTRYFFYLIRKILGVSRLNPLLLKLRKMKHSK